MPCTPIAESASRTSSSLNGLMIAVTSFMCGFPWLGLPSASELVDALNRVRQQALAQAAVVRVDRLVGPVLANFEAHVQVVRHGIAEGRREFTMLGSSHSRHAGIGVRRSDRCREPETILVVE